MSRGQPSTACERERHIYGERRSTWPTAADKKSLGKQLTRGGVILAALLMAAMFTQTQDAFASPSKTALGSAPYYFGDLVTMPEHAQYESSHGVKVAMLELGWNAYEPRDGQFDSNYAASVKAKLKALQGAGMRVTLVMGLHNPPSWVYNYPNARYVDQNGALAGRGCSSTNEVNLIFNQVLRQKVEGYFDQINRDLGLQNFWAIRLTSGGDCEMSFPQGGSYWAFDANAQNGPDMPPSMARNPFPGWKPGQKTYNGQPFSTSQVGQWANWYVKALDNVADWQINTFDSLGFQGYYQTLTPGSGSRPSAYASDINNYLPNSITGVGAVWQTFYEFLPSKQRVVAYVSSMADNSGGNDSCQSSDDNVALTDPAANSWSATRWVSRIADQYHLLKSGENPGYDFPGYTDTSSAGLMANTLRQMQSCGFQGMYWAHDDRLWDGTLPISLYASYIANANGGTNTMPPMPAISSGATTQTTQPPSSASGGSAGGMSGSTPALTPTAGGVSATPASGPLPTGTPLAVSQGAGNTTNGQSPSKANASGLSQATSLTDDAAGLLSKAGLPAGVITLLSTAAALVKKVGLGHILRRWI